MRRTELLRTACFLWNFRLIYNLGIRKAAERILTLQDYIVRLIDLYTLVFFCEGDADLRLILLLFPICITHCSADIALQRLSGKLCIVHSVLQLQAGLILTKLQYISEMIDASFGIDIL